MKFLVICSNLSNICQIKESKYFLRLKKYLRSFPTYFVVQSCVHRETSQNCDAKISFKIWSAYVKRIIFMCFSKMAFVFKNIKMFSSKPIKCSHKRKGEFLKKKWSFDRNGKIFSKKFKLFSLKLWFLLREKRLWWWIWKVFFNAILPLISLFKC